MDGCWGQHNWPWEGRATAGSSGRKSLLLQLPISLPNRVTTKRTKCHPSAWLPLVIVNTPNGAPTRGCDVAAGAKHQLHLSSAPVDWRDTKFLDLLRFPAEVLSGSTSPSKEGNQTKAVPGSSPFYDSGKMDAYLKMERTALVPYLRQQNVRGNASEILELQMDLFTWSCTLLVLLQLKGRNSQTLLATKHISESGRTVCLHHTRFFSSCLVQLNSFFTFCKKSCQKITLTKRFFSVKEMLWNNLHAFPTFWKCVSLTRRALLIILKTSRYEDYWITVCYHQKVHIFSYILNVTK